MEPKAAQRRLLEDVLFTLIKNKESFSFDKLEMLFPLLSREIIKEQYETALGHRSLLDKVMKMTPTVETYVELKEQEKSEKISKISTKIQKQKLPQNYISSTTKPIVTIHVLDETNDQKSDFLCSRALLVKEMKYFNDYLPEEESALR